MYDKKNNKTSHTKDLRGQVNTWLQDVNIRLTTGMYISFIMDVALHQSSRS